MKTSRPSAESVATMTDEQFATRFEHALPVGPSARKDLDYLRMLEAMIARQIGDIEQAAAEADDACKCGHPDCGAC